MTHPMIVHDAKEMAGAFYEKDRSDTFRATWPDQDDYVNAKWGHFVAPVRAGYAELLAHPGVPQEQKDRMYDALVADVPAATSEGAASPLPIFKDTANFHGDRAENRRTVDAIGRGPRSMAAKLRSTTALIMPGR